MKKNALLIAVCALAVGGCATPTPEPRSAAEACTAPKVTVTVDYGLSIRAIPNTIDVCARNAPIVWIIDPQQTKYVFPADGILIKYNDGEFDDCRVGKNGVRQGNDRLFICKDLNNKHGQKPPRPYKYSIKLLTNDGSTPPPELDPVIMND